MKNVMERANRIVARGKYPAEAKKDLPIMLRHLLRRSLLPRPDEKISWWVAWRFWRWAKKRSHAMPFAYLVGEKEFFSLPFFVNRHTLIPRPISENICHAVIKNYHKNNRLTVLDLGTGSGCLLLTLLYHFPHALGVGVDISRAGLDVAKKNSKRLAVQKRTKFIKGDFTKKNFGKATYNIIVSNPPYVAPTDYKKLAPNIFYEPTIAVLSPLGGLYFYHFIKLIADRHIKKNGLLVVECAPSQKQQVATMLQSNHYRTVVIG